MEKATILLLRFTQWYRMKIIFGANYLNPAVVITAKILQWR